jgi:hypothetical protein
VTEPTPERPRQVTMAGWMIMVGSVFALALVVERLSGLHTLESQERIESFLAKPPGSDLGVSVDTVIALIRTLAMVTAGCATAAGILGYQVLRRSRSARVAVTVLAVPLFLAGMVTGGFITSVVAASAAILWLQPARSWFDGTPAPERRKAPVAVPPPVPTPLGPPPPPAPPGSLGPPPPTVSWPAPPRPAAPAPAADARPASVLWACVLTWASSGLVVLLLVASSVALAVRPGLMLDEVHRENPDLASQGVSDAAVVALAFVMIAGLVVWCVAVSVLALLVLRGVDWARIVLVVSAAVCSVGCLIGAVIGAFLLVVPLLASAVCIGLLVRPETRPWFERRG